jgi:hypothetical protein
MPLPTFGVLAGCFDQGRKRRAAAAWRRRHRLGLDAGDDAVHLLAVGGGLFGGRLQQARLQREQRLRVLGRDGGQTGFGGLVEAGLDDLQVERGELLDAFESLGTEPIRG